MDNPKPELVLLHSPASPRAEAFRVLKARLDRATPNGRPSSLLVTSPTTAEAGTEVVLVDLDLHGPRLHGLLDLPDGPGALQCLESGTPVQDCLKPGPLPALSVLAAGGEAEVPARLLGSRSLTELLAELSEGGRVVVLAGPPAMPAADASLLSGAVDGVILVTTAHRTSRSSVREALARLEGAGANVLGAVLDGYNGS
jgi:Mrp family chromosome partitioning ATPase